ncbi:MAG: bifunctional diaminohydroxyphosphoribosylaminopyrimidine deaminase/5-amino-6-(5-phosphoribosylamino)uracil reductase RibD [Caldimicrobium sp.]
MKLKSMEFYMKIAIKEAYKGLGKTSPNPPVGAVLVHPRTGEIIAKGYHRAYGMPHAEREAIIKAGNKAKGAILYVTLEPCCHYGKTPPCTEIILSSGIKKVICGIRDPNPIACNGLVELKNKGIEVEVGVLAEEVKYLTRFFLSRILRRRPWITIKVAQSIDGRIATSTGDSKWISGKEALVFAHKLRSMVDAIVVGKNTVAKDNPELTTRLVKGRNPIRIVLDSKLSLTPNYKVFEVATNKQTILVCGEVVEKKKLRPFLDKGVKIWLLPLKNGRIDLRAFIDKTYEEGINSLLIEGGGILHGAFMKENLVDEIFAVIAPLIIGDPKGIFSFNIEPIEKLTEAYFLSLRKYSKLGDCLMFNAFTKEGENLINTPLEFL